MNPIKHSVTNIPLPKDLHKRAELGVAQAQKKKSKKWIALPVASLLLASSITAGATMNESMNQLVSLISPKFAQLLQPIEMVTIEQGIRIEVLSAMQDKHSAVIYLAVSDVEKNRITSNLDVYDFSVSKGSSFNAQTIDYNESTRTAIVRLLASNGIEANRLTLRIQNLIGNKAVINANVPIQLNHVTQQTPQQLADDAISGMGGVGLNPLSRTVLPKGNLNIHVPNYKGMTIKNIGIVDGKLHVQIEWLEETVDHARFYLVDKENKKMESHYSISYGRDEYGNVGYGRNFNEYVFHVGALDLSSSTLATAIYQYGDEIHGDWQVSFHLEPIESKTVQLNERIQDWQATSLEFSALGISLHGNGRFQEGQPIQATIYMADGSSKTLSNYILMLDDSASIVTWYGDQVLDYKEIKSMEINGVVIDL